MPEYDEVDALITFYESWRENGIAEDGLPLYEQVVMIRKAKPPLLQIDEVATEDDQDQFPAAWKHFEKTRQVRDLAIKGYPLALWPVIAPHELKLLAARDIVTVEQLAAFEGRKGNDMPPAIHELAVRAKKLLAMQGKIGKFEAIIHELTAQRDQLNAELTEARATISAQNSMLEHLRQRPAAA